MQASSKRRPANSNGLRGKGWRYTLHALILVNSLFTLPKFRIRELAQIHSGPTCIFLNVTPSSHSSATKRIMLNGSMWCLPTNIHKDW